MGCFTRQPRGERLSPYGKDAEKGEIFPGTKPLADLELTT